MVTSRGVYKETHLSVDDGAKAGEFLAQPVIVNIVNKVGNIQFLAGFDGIHLNLLKPVVQRGVRCSLVLTAASNVINISYYTDTQNNIE